MTWNTRSRCHCHLSWLLLLNVHTHTHTLFELCRTSSQNHDKKGAGILQRGRSNTLMCSQVTVMKPLLRLCVRHMPACPQVVVITCGLIVWALRSVRFTVVRPGTGELLCICRWWQVGGTGWGICPNKPGSRPIRWFDVVPQLVKHHHRGYSNVQRIF